MKVLLTKKLPADDLQFIASHGWEFAVAETLKVIPVQVRNVPTSEGWVVSSKNSFDVVKKFIHQAPQTIFCIGAKMKNQIGALRNDLNVNDFRDMKSLVQDILRGKFKSIVYLCGQEHRSELNDALKGYETEITKVICYQSEMTFPKVDTKVDVVFVFSPRGVESLLKHNSFDNSVIFASIGSTTSAYLRECGVKNIFTSSYPDTRILLEEFVTKNQLNFYKN